jgi:ribonucleoside-triphosphate reductase (formate)
MNCPFCGSEDVKVVDKRSSDGSSNRRRRECNSCKKRFTTYERVEGLELAVLKKTGLREPFSPEKLKSGFLKACEKTNISEEKIGELVEEIEKECRDEFGEEVKSTAIGEKALEKLRPLDEVAYLRFASVYRAFDSVEKFEREASSLKTKPARITSKIKKVRKRDGRVVPFDKEKIVEALYKAAIAVGGRNKKLAREIAGEVVFELDRVGLTEPSVEDVQDMVEKVLIEGGHVKTAKAFILYRKQHEKMRSLKSTFLDIHGVMEGYLKQSDWRTKENSNVDYSFSGLMLHTAGSVIANYVLNEMYPAEISDAHRNGYFHIHDLSAGIVGYCAGWSLKNLLARGFGGVPNKVDAKPAKHLDVVVHQMVNFLGCTQMEFAGAQAFSSVDTLLAPFVKSEELSYKEVKQAMQTMIFSLNIPSRWGSQMPFTNLTFDWTVPDDLKGEHAIIGGLPADFTYGECQKEMDMINRAFLEVMKEGDALGRIFTFPIPTYNLTKDFDWDTENARRLFEMTARYGTPYFQNYVGSKLDPSSVRAMCCRLSLDLNELRNKGNGLFGAGEQTGSIGVVTLNVNRLAYEAKTKSEFFEKLGRYMDLARDSLEIKRKVINKNMAEGLMPYSKTYLGTFEHHFSTIGLVGMNEACLNLLGKNLFTGEGKEFAIETLEFMRGKLKEYQKETGNLYNLEATPAEGTSYRLARIDKKAYPEIITSGQDEPYLTNSTQLPVDATDDLFEALNHQNDLQTMYTGGTVFHSFLGEKVSDWKACRSLVKKIAHTTRLPYFSISPTFSICPEHGYIPGEHFVCPCGRKTTPGEKVLVRDD